ncbi:MAG: hypothetical protein HQL95_13265, partial [Magnetococcales bacterium]|nr:hypothetical protein [Magnetococcales bacterium]
MSIVNPKYRRLYAQQQYLTDEVVLIQAWKKSQRYIRKSNWYADLLELDQSALLLEGWVKEWIKDLDTGNAQPVPMRMVPAPKTHRWGFEKKEWRPIESEDGKKQKKAIHLRPLAHLGIREQSMATAAMLCLADCIETAQGDTSITDYFEARRRGIHSYGNRLYCFFDPDTIGDSNRPKPLAQFSWGNSETFSRYYNDYTRFLDRPRIVAANVQDQLGGDEELYIIKLDISAFFDRIHRPTLIARLQDEYEAFVSCYTLADGNADDRFWDSLKQIFAWEWNPADDALKQFLKEKVKPDGLPQGLVASGFFANAYLLEFDRCISGMLKKHLGYGEVEKAVKSIRSTSGWNHDLDFVTFRFDWQCGTEDQSGLPDLPNITIHDYCRYVDDIRLVVSVKGDGEARSRIREEITRWMNAWLNAAANPPPGVSNQHCLKLNSGKTEVIRFRLMDGQIGVTSRMSLIQSELSGPTDMDTLQQTTAGLDALLSLTDQFDCCLPLGDEAHPLSTIASPKTEIRDDTLKRFAAYRLLKTLRLRRSMTNLESEIGPGLKARDAIDHELEMFARKLIRAWTHDPSLTLVLRYGMDLFPSPELLRPVLDGLRQVIIGTNKARAMVGWYICADLLRAGAMETGFQTRDLEMPDAADLGSYRVQLIDFAREILDPRKLGKKSPWYAQQQSLLLLAVLEPCPAMAYINSAPETQHYSDLLQTAVYPQRSFLQQDDLVLAMVFQQLHLDAQRFAKWFVDSLKASSPNDRLQHLQLVSFNRPDLMVQVLNEIDIQQLEWITDAHGYLKFPKGMHNKSRDMTDLDGEEVILWNVVTHTDNPFGQEIQWLKLAHELVKNIQTLVDEESTRMRFSLHNIIITVKSWQRLKQPELGAGKLMLQFNSLGRQDPRLVTPDWCVANKRWFYVLGRLLRSVITGEQDFTLTPYLNKQEWDSYSGMRNSWYTRRLGMMHTPESLGGEAAPFSPWVSELLMRLLQWPGVRVVPGLITNWENVETLDDLAALVRNRLVRLRAMYGKSSDLPIYPIPIGRDQFSGKNGTLRVVLAQTLLPKQVDFTKADPSLSNSPTYRALHRCHLSTLCNLIWTQMDAQRSVEGEDELTRKSTADLIVLPELTVHPDDVWILKRLSDKTKAMIFFGMTPILRPGVGLVNTACWLIPNQKNTGRSWIIRHQGKHHPTTDEKAIGVQGWRPYQVVIELSPSASAERGYRMTGAICYDATDLNLSPPKEPRARLKPADRPATLFGRILA